MPLTLAQKFDALHAAEDTVRKALGDLVDASTGESIPPDGFVVDLASGLVFSNAAGKVVRKKATVIPAKS